VPPDNSDPWNVLRVLRRIEVGPTRVEPRRIVAPYRVFVNDRIEETSLIYRFEEAVFDPRQVLAANLASMMAAQVALNYGLFAEEIVFHGVYDRLDRAFLRDMAENTAREITVIKFLQPNPFLRGPAAALPAIRRERYCHARLRFVDSGTGHGSLTADAAPWSRDATHHAVLSSGGKESLLTLGVLREIGKTCYPIFVNESGRHWLTALNAHRHLAATQAGTTRVWTNSDRVFAWFLRHLPFVRQDFANVRSDEYPIRLWTVAVFLFGALPVMHRHGVGRLLIGDEFDTSRRARHLGIAHYDGLYDQSRYFDVALTRYFERKGWGILQFSLARWLSELLVQKTLAARYPDLFRHQVSCHAAHIRDGRVRPCGRCEKCRRVVSMLVSLGADPLACGYTEAQVRSCLQRVAKAGVHQEAPAAEHLAFLLREQGLLDADAVGLPPPRSRPEVLNLRFDPDKSPLTTIPEDLRKPVLEILLRHADGAVRNVRGRWLGFDPLAENEVHRNALEVS
jgi:hypothetical protein